MSNASFLPEDYLEQKAERRTNFISLTLFAIVMVSVFAAFLVTNRKWSQVKSAQEEINSQYQEFASQIETYDELQAQKREMEGRAEIAASLVERVPRSILIWELIAKMPQRLGLIDLEIKSERMKVTAAPAARKSNQGPRRLGRRPGRAPTVSKAQGGKPAEVEAPRYHVTLKLLGVAPTDSEVSQYMDELGRFGLVQDVRLEYTERKQIEGREMRQFAMTMALNPKFDARHLTPVVKGSLGDPMSDELRFTGSGKGGR